MSYDHTHLMLMHKNTNGYISVIISIMQKLDWTLEVEIDILFDISVFKIEGMKHADDKPLHTKKADQIDPKL